MSHRRITLFLAFAVMAFCASVSAQTKTAPRSPNTGRLLPFLEPEIQQPSPDEAQQAIPVAPQWNSLLSGYTFPGFVAPALYNAGQTADTYGSYSVAEADFDGKNGTDVATVQIDGQLTVLLNDGSGHFNQAYTSTTPVFANISSIQAIDLNGDGLPDIVGTDIAYGAIGFYVWINQGSGQFAAPVKTFIKRPSTISSSYNYSFGSLKLADVNGDGHADLVIPVTWLNSTTGVSILTVFTYLGNADGTFNAPLITTYPLPTYSYVLSGHGVELADLGKTGKLSLILQLMTTNTSRSFYSTNVAVASGNGDGTFSTVLNQTSMVAAVSISRGDLLVSDFNNDGILDVMYSDGNDNVQLSTGVGDGTLNTPNAVITGVASVENLIMGDVNHDSIPDIITIRSGVASVFLGTGNGAYNPAPAAQYSGGLAGVQPQTLADFDGDGNPDFIWVEPTYNQMSVYFGHGDGTFRGALAIAPANKSQSLPNNTQRATEFQVLATGNYNGTAQSGVLAQETNYIDTGFSDATGNITFVRSFDATQLTNVDFVEPIRVDLDGDGKTDVVMATLSGVKTALSKGGGAWTSLTNTSVATKLDCPLGYGDAGDINGDGHADLVIAYTGTAFCGVSGTSVSGFAVLLGDGTGKFISSTFTAFGSEVYRARLYDIDGDGKLDLVLIDITSGADKVYILRGLGDGTFDTANPHLIYSGIYSVSDVRAADINGDGKLDLLMTYNGASAASTSAPSGILKYIGNADFTFTGPTYIYQGGSGPSLEIGDFNGDGVVDFAVPQRSPVRTQFGLSVVLGTGGGNFAAPINYLTPIDESNDIDTLIFTGDFNGDGTTDVLLGGGAGYVPSILFLNEAGTTLNLSAQPSAPTQGDPVQLVVQPSLLQPGLLNGQVVFTSNGNSLGSATWNGNIATLTVPSLPVGTDVIRATYTGDSTHAGSAATPLSLTVSSLIPAFSLTANSTGLSITQGSSGTLQLMETANAAWNGPVILSCLNLPANATCSFSPSSSTLTAGSAVSVLLTVATTASASLQTPGFRPRSGGVVFACLLLLFLPGGAKRRLRLCLITLLSVSLATAVGCSSSAPTGGTPIGTTLITVQAVGTSGTAALTQNVVVTTTVASR